MQCFVQETKERQSTARNHHNKPDKRVKLLGKFHRPPLNPSKLESANYFIKQKYFQQIEKLPPRETRMIAPVVAPERSSTSGGFSEEKMSQMRAVLQEAGQTLEAVLRLVVPGHQEFRRKMETNQSFGERTVAAFIFSSLALATILAL